MIEQQDFFEKYRIDKDAFESTNIDWKELVDIHDDYVSVQNNLEPTGTYIADCLRQLEAVDSLRIRLKDPQHLIEKIIRHKLEDNSLDINPGNYRDKITDLIGVRALHLFKENWASIHDFITKNWELHEKPTANVRKGDPEEFIAKFKEKGCVIYEHKFGYRSVHYIVKSQPAKQLHLAEIQVRTIFEEGFSEIDHQVRYPYYQDNLILASYLAIFNRLAGSADEMGSFVIILKTELDEYDQKTKELMIDREDLGKRVKDQITKLKIAKEEKEKLQKNLDKLSSTEFRMPRGSTSITFSPDSSILTSPIVFDKDLLLEPSETFTFKLPESGVSVKRLLRAEQEEPEEESKTKKKKGKRKPKK